MGGPIPKKRRTKLAASIASALAGTWVGLFVFFAISPAANTQPTATMVFGGVGALAGIKFFPWAWEAFARGDAPGEGPDDTKSS